MVHPLVNQLHFVRNEFQRCLTGLQEEDGVKRILPMNCISWMVGHLAFQESTYWIYLGQGKTLFPELREMAGSGKPPSTPSLSEMQSFWQDITAQANVFLEGLTSLRMQEHFSHRGKELEENIGTLLYRNIYHYWFHTGEAHAIRQMLGHQNLPDFVGSMEGFSYRAE